MTHICLVQQNSYKIGKSYFRGSTDCLAQDACFLIKHTNLSCKIVTIKTNSFYFTGNLLSAGKPVASRRSWKNFWLKMKATPLISSTLASAVVLRLMKFAVIAIASLPRNSFRRNPAGRRKWQCWKANTPSERDQYTTDRCTHTVKGEKGIDELQTPPKRKEKLLHQKSVV